jgi:hypothetical protein
MISGTLIPAQRAHFIVSSQGIRLILIGCPFHDAETGHAVECIGLNFKALVRNLFMTPAASAVVVGLHQSQGMFDTAEFVECPDPHLHGEILVELRGSLIDRVGVQRGFHIGA